MYAAIRPCEKGPDIWPFVIGGIVSDNVDHSLVGIASLNLGQQLRGTNAVDGDWLDKGRVEGSEVQRPMDVYAATPCCSFDRRVWSYLYPAMAGFFLIFRMYSISEIGGFICAQIAHQTFVQCDKCGLLFSRDNARQVLGLAIFKPQPGKKLDASRVRVVQAKFC